MSEKFKSRKFWIMLGSIVALVVTEFTGYQVNPEVIAGLGAVIVVWLGGQSYVDKGKVVADGPRDSVVQALQHGRIGKAL